MLGATGCGLAMVASLLVGGTVEIDRALDDGWTLGLDWFLLNLFLLGGQLAYPFRVRGSPP